MGLNAMDLYFIFLGFTKKVLNYIGQGLTDQAIGQFLSLDL